MFKEKLCDQEIDNYFIDITYKIIPKHYKKYRMMTITCPEKTNNTYIACLILLQYEDHISFTKIFKYLHEMFNFSPKVVHFDYSNSLLNALLTENLFIQKPIIIHCFFHLFENIVIYMKKYGIIKKNITKYAFEIIKNVELLCFISPNFIESYGKFLKNKLTDETEILLFNYIEKNWLSKASTYYNYYQLFFNDYLKEGIQHFYSTNNREESLQNKLNLYFPNKKVTNHSFITSIRNVIENYEIKKEKIIRHDYITKSLIYYSKGIKKNQYNWLDYATFKNIEQKIIKDENNNLEINNIINIIKTIIIK